MGSVYDEGVALADFERASRATGVSLDDMTLVERREIAEHLVRMAQPCTDPACLLTSAGPTLAMLAYIASAHGDREALFVDFGRHAVLRIHALEDVVCRLQDRLDDLAAAATPAATPAVAACTPPKE